MKLYTNDGASTPPTLARCSPLPIKGRSTVPAPRAFCTPNERKAGYIILRISPCSVWRTRANRPLIYAGTGYQRSCGYIILRISRCSVCQYR